MNHLYTELFPVDVLEQQQPGRYLFGQVKLNVGIGVNIAIPCIIYCQSSFFLYQQMGSLPNIRYKLYSIDMRCVCVLFWFGF